MNKIKILPILLFSALAFVVGCDSAANLVGMKANQQAVVDSMVQSHLNTLRAELLEECDKQVADAVSVRVEEMIAAAAGLGAAKTTTKKAPPKKTTPPKVTPPKPAPPKAEPPKPAPPKSTQSSRSGASQEGVKGQQQNRSNAAKKDEPGKQQRRSGAKRIDEK